MAHAGGKSHHDSCFSAKLHLGPTDAWGQAWVEAGPVGSSPVSFGEISALLHAPHLPLPGGGMLPTGNGEDRKQRLLLSVFPLRSGAAERASHSLLSLCLSPSFSSPSPFPSSSLSSLLPFDVEESCLPLARLYREGIRSFSERSAPLL